MNTHERPLLARQHSDPSSHGAEEEDALLTGQPTYKSDNRKQKWREVGAWTWAVLSTIAVVVLAVAFSQERAMAEKRKAGNCGKKQPDGKRNLVFMVSDGMGPTSVELARSFRQYREKLPWDDLLTLDKHLIGQSRTRSSSSLITDSAAGATAFSCGFKSYNGAISILPDHTPCGTVLEAAKKAGYMTGLVVTTRVTDATPACFASHAQARRYEDLIAEHLLGHYPLGRMVDLIIGGGRCHFLPNTTHGSCRADDKDLVAEAKSEGWTYVDNKEDLFKLDPKGGVKFPLLALVADRNIPFEIDRRHIPDKYPSQLEMANFALDVLKAATADRDKGFFIMIEGSRIDHGGHNNDPAAQVHEVLIHDQTFNAVLEFFDQDSTPGALISTSDHETGGLSAAVQLTDAYPPYVWYPGVLANATSSSEDLAIRWELWYTIGGGKEAPREEQLNVVNKMIKEGFGFEGTPEEIASIVDTGSSVGKAVPPLWLFSEMISKRARLGWSTHGHSAVDVNIYGSDPAILSAVVGNHENTEVGRLLADYLDVDVDAVTKELREKKFKTGPSASRETREYAWTGEVPGTHEVVQRDEYHTEFW